MNHALTTIGRQRLCHGVIQHRRFPTQMNFLTKRFQSSKPSGQGSTKSGANHSERKDLVRTPEPEPKTRWYVILGNGIAGVAITAIGLRLIAPLVMSGAQASRISGGMAPLAVLSVGGLLYFQVFSPRTMGVVIAMGAISGIAAVTTMDWQANQEVKLLKQGIEQVETELRQNQKVSLVQQSHGSQITRERIDRLSEKIEITAQVRNPLDPQAKEKQTKTVAVRGSRTAPWKSWTLDTVRID